MSDDRECAREEVGAVYLGALSWKSYGRTERGNVQYTHRIIGVLTEIRTWYFSNTVQLHLFFDLRFLFVF